MGYGEVKERVKLILQETLDEMLSETGKEWNGEIIFDETPSIELGDFATTVSFQLARVFRRAPKLIAEDIV
jgi:arginyl-tRNA synthetase